MKIISIMFMLALIISCYFELDHTIKNINYSLYDEEGKRDFTLNISHPFSLKSILSVNHSESKFKIISKDGAVISTYSKIINDSNSNLFSSDKKIEEKDKKISLTFWLDEFHSVSMTHELCRFGMLVSWESKYEKRSTL